MHDPSNAAAPGMNTEGGTKIQQGDADTSIVRELLKWSNEGGRVSRRAILSRRNRIEGADARARASRALDKMLATTHEWKPQTFGLSDEQRRALGCELVEHQGWFPWEVRARIAAPRSGGRQ